MSVTRSFSSSWGTCWSGTVKRPDPGGCAAEEFAAIGGGGDLVLMRPGKMTSRRARGRDDVLGQQVEYSLLFVSGHVSREQVIEAAILTDDDDHVLDRRGSLDHIDRRVGIGSLHGCDQGKGRQHRCGCAGGDLRRPGSGE